MNIEEKLIELNENIDGLGDGLMNLESQVSNMIKTITVSGTTSEFGNMKLNGLHGNRIVIGVSSPSGVILMPYLNKNGNWYVHAINASTNENVVNASLDVVAKYI